ncbi:MAG: hypothetical protein PHD03_04675 [Bacilli bacterium]|nr:hypothetical protein [Bacilli bacterium]MDD4406897.1 hypothetical protein [Bacilli bacterium]
MKQLILLLLMLLLMPIYSNAEILYTDYYLLEKDSDNYYEESDMIKRKETYKYLNFNYERNEEGYYLLNKNPSSLPLIDKNDYIKKSNKDYLMAEDGPITEHFIDENINVKYIKINNFITNQTSIKNISIYSGEELIFYYIYDKNFYYRKIIPSNGKLIIDLRAFYPLNSLSLIIRFETSGLEEISYDIGFTNDLINYQTFHNNILRSNLKENHKLNFINKDTITEVVLYKYYNLKRVDSNIYSEEPLLNFEHDLLNYKKTYTYYKRDKIEINDKIVNINDPIVKYSSANILNITNLDLFTNGNQEVKICLINNNCLNKNILVNIPKEEKIKVTISNVKYKNKKEINNKPKYSITNDIEDTKIKNLNITNEDVNNIKRDKNNHYLNILVIIFIIILTFFIIIRKRNRTNVEMV